MGDWQLCLLPDILQPGRKHRGLAFKENHELLDQRYIFLGGRQRTGSSASLQSVWASAWGRDGSSSCSAVPVSILGHVPEGKKAFRSSWNTFILSWGLLRTIGRMHATTGKPYPRLYIYRRYIFFPIFRYSPLFFSYWDFLKSSLSALRPVEKSHQGAKRLLL